MHYELRFAVSIDAVSAGQNYDILNHYAYKLQKNIFLTCAQGVDQSWSPIKWNFRLKFQKNSFKIFKKIGITGKKALSNHFEL